MMVAVGVVKTSLITYSKPCFHWKAQSHWSFIHVLKVLILNLSVLTQIHLGTTNRRMNLVWKTNMRNQTKMLVYEDIKLFYRTILVNN